MKAKKIKVFVLVFILTLVFAASLHTPKQTEALWILGHVFEILCDECQGQWRTCCRNQCYQEILYGQENSYENTSAYNDCVESCTIGLASYCHAWY